MESYNNEIQIVFWKTWNLLKWAGLKKVKFLGLRDTPYTCKYHGLQNMLIGSWDI